MFTRFRTSALIPCFLLAGLAGAFIYVGEYCAAATLGGVIGMVGTQFAGVKDAEVRGARLERLGVRDGDA